MADGFSLGLQDYCSYCGDFEPDVEKTEVTRCGDETRSYITVIGCKNACKCLRINKKLEGRLNSDKSK